MAISYFHHHFNQTHPLDSCRFLRQKSQTEKQNMHQEKFASIHPSSNPPILQPLKGPKCWTISGEPRSPTHQVWLEAIVQRIHQDPKSYDLNIKANADPTRPGMIEIDGGHENCLVDFCHPFSPHGIFVRMPWGSQNPCGKELEIRLMEDIRLTTWDV